MKFAPNSGIQKAITGYERQVSIHSEKIANPTKFVQNWGQMTVQQQVGLINHWRQDLARNQELANVLQGLLKSR